MSDIPKPKKYKYYATWDNERKPRCLGVENGREVYNSIAHGYMKGKSGCKDMWKIHAEITAEQARKLIKANEGNSVIRLRGVAVGKKLIEKGKVK